MPSDPELVDLLERIERHAWADMVAAAPPDFAAAIGLLGTLQIPTRTFALHRDALDPVS